MVGMISVVKQNCDFGDVNGFRPKVIQIATQQFNQSLVIGNVGFRAMGEEGKPQSINGKMAFDAIGAFVVTKPFGGNTGVTSIFDRLRVNDE